MSYYSNKKKTDPVHPGNNKEGSPKDINDPYYGTGDAASNKPADTKANTSEPAPPTVHKDYDASENSGGSHSSSEKWED